MFHHRNLRLTSAIAASLLLLAGVNPAPAQHGGGHGGGGGGAHGGMSAGYHGGSTAYHGGTAAYHGGTYYHGGGYYNGNYYHGGYYRNYYGYGYPGFGLGFGLGLGYGIYGPSGYYYAAPYYAYDAGVYDPSLVVDSGAAMPSQSAYPQQPPQQQQQQVQIPAGEARLLVVLPNADAQVWFNGGATTSQGMQREFRTTDLDPAKQYTYTIKVRWQENGHPVEHSRAVTVHSGQGTLVDFTRPETIAKPPVAMP